MSKKDEFSILNRSANSDDIEGEKKGSSSQKVYFIAILIFAAMYVGFKIFG